MSEEEKKAIDTLKEVASDNFDTLGDDISPKMAQNILNVINKQQKEIEELKRKQTNIEKDYISKEKIDEMIKKLFKQELMYAEDDNRTIPLIKKQNLLFHIECEDWEEVFKELKYE